MRYSHSTVLAMLSTLSASERDALLSALAVTHGDTLVTMAETLTATLWSPVNTEEK